MKIIDISMKISQGMVVYEGDPPVRIEQVQNIPEDGVAVSKIRMGLHTGTHVDAPAHYIEGGETIDEVSPGSLVGDALVCDLTFVEGEIGRRDLEKFDIRENSIVLLKTRNSCLLKRKRFSRKFVCLGRDGADYLAEKNVKAVGIDYLSIEKFGHGRDCVHKKLLSNRILIIEGLDLENAGPGAYKIVCLPLRVKGGEAAPARCILIE